VLLTSGHQERQLPHADALLPREKLRAGMLSETGRAARRPSMAGPADERDAGTGPGQIAARAGPAIFRGRPSVSAADPDPPGSDEEYLAKGSDVLGR
jgi:hypothetical protein